MGHKPEAGGRVKSWPDQIAKMRAEAEKLPDGEAKTVLLTKAEQLAAATLMMDSFDAPQKKH